MKSTLNMSVIRREWNVRKENNLIINKGIKDRLDFLKEAKTTTIDIRDFKNQEKFKLRDLIKDNDSNKTINLQIVNNNNLKNDIKNKKKIDIPEYDIDVKSINEEFERTIYELMSKIKDPNLCEYQKRNIILYLEKTMTEDIRIDRKHRLEIEKIRKEYNEKYFSNNKTTENDDNLNAFEKKEIFIKKEKTESTVIENSDKALVNNLTNTTINNDSTLNISNYNNYSINDNSSIINESTRDETQFGIDPINSTLDISNNNNYSINDNSSIINESTRDETQLEIDPMNKSKTNQNEKKDEKIFNKLRADYYIKNKIFDKVYYDEKEENKIITSPKYKIDERHYGLLYDNDLTTNYITKSTYLSGKKIISELTEKEKEGRSFNESVGLIFCGKEIKLEKDGKTVIKKCEPNNFICKECMEVNKKYYNIKNTYLINIKGRVSKLNKGSFHCFGHFNCENHIEDCATKFSCKACEILNTYEDYYK